MNNTVRIIVILVLAATFLSVQVNGTPTVSEIDSCQDLTMSNHIYKLTRNIPNLQSCFEIKNANDVTLDCQGHTMKGTSKMIAMIIMENVDTWHIKNCNFDGYVNAISAHGTPGIIENSDFIDIRQDLLCIPGGNNPDGVRISGKGNRINKATPLIRNCVSSPEFSQFTSVPKVNGYTELEIASCGEYTGGSKVLVKLTGDLNAGSGPGVCMEFGEDIILDCQGHKVTVGDGRSFIRITDSPIEIRNCIMPGSISILGPNDKALQLTLNNNVISDDLISTRGLPGCTLNNIPQSGIILKGENNAIIVNGNVQSASEIKAIGLRQGCQTENIVKLYTQGPYDQPSFLKIHTSIPFTFAAFTTDEISPLRIQTATSMQQLILVDTSDPAASPVRIMTSSGIKSIKRIVS